VVFLQDWRGRLATAHMHARAEKNWTQPKKVNYVSKYMPSIIGALPASTVRSTAGVTLKPLLSREACNEKL